VEDRQVKMDFVISTRGLTKVFAKHCVLDGINLDIARGKLFGLVGPNGAGKTTFLRILSTLILPTSAGCYINGYSVSNEKDAGRIRSFINLVSEEERSFYWRLTGRQNLRFFGSLYNIQAHSLENRIKETASLLEIENQLDCMFKDYSSGTKQKMAIARGLLNNPEIIFMDEPTRNLDVKIKRKIYEFIKFKLVDTEGKTIVLASHHLDEVERFCDYILFMDKSKIVMHDTLEQAGMLC